MNSIVKDQLSKVQRVKIPPFDESTTELILDRDSMNTNEELQEDNCYLISVDDYILNPPDGFTLHTNWNNNTCPKHKFMKIDVSKIMGKMVKVNSIGYDMDNKVDTKDMWSGWLPQKAMTIIERL